LRGRRRRPAGRRRLRARHPPHPAPHRAGRCALAGAGPGGDRLRLGRGAVRAGAAPRGPVGRSAAAAEPLRRLARGRRLHPRHGGRLVRGARGLRCAQEAGPQGLGAHGGALPRCGSGAVVSARVAVLSLGGTIVMSQDAAGGNARPDDSAGERLLAAVETGVEIQAHPLANVSSSDVRPHHLAAVLAAARTTVDEGADGVVLTHGTDTLEETAFLLERYWDREAPLV